MQYSQIQFHGEPGITRSCLAAVVRLIHFGDKIDKAALLSNRNEHCFILTTNLGDRIAVKRGFTSGYPGEGPRGLATALQILYRHGAEIEEYLVSSTVLKMIDESALRMRQLKEIDSLRPSRPSRWFDYIYAFGSDPFTDDRYLNSQFPLALPYALLDPRVTDLALTFIDSPDESLLSAYRRLEDLVRKKTGLVAESSARLFSKAFQGDNPILVWKEVEAGEQKARASLFTAVYRAFRNPRAHKEPSEGMAAAVREFLLLNELFLLEAQTVRQDTVVQGARPNL